MKPFDPKEHNSEWELDVEEQEKLRKYMNIPVPKELDDRLAARMAQMKTPKPSRRMNWQKIALTAAASILLIFSLGMLTSSTFADYIKSIFMQNNDPGLKEAFKNGFSQSINKEVTDQGITVRVKEVVADLNRIAVSVEMINEKGEMIDPTLTNPGVDGDYYLTDKKGNIINRAALSPTWSRTWKPLGGIIEFDFATGPNTETVFFHMDLSNVGVKTNELGEEINPGVNGSWKLKIPIDTRKGKIASKVIQLNKSWNGEHDLKLTLDELMLSPSLTRLMYHVDQSDQLTQLPDDDASDFQTVNMRYFITDDHGKKVATYGVEPSNSGAESTNSEIQHPPLTKSKYYEFHLTGISYANVVEKEIFSISAKTLPMTKNTKEGKITIKTIRKDSEGNAVIRIEGERPKDIDTYTWIIRDELGQEEELISHGSVNGKKSQGDRCFFTENLIVNGELLSDKVQLELVAVKKYHPTNWSFKINGY
ncbi:DUF4179 domain-containing protein [Shimazuella kribbensis]|uniref:DUF4179 domain-containing protein n=1 Tax=Shimazuella kribbensis TaxID=139808 RepID=UPI00040D6433|nr:DUF4179 domain-containing protein [Shimazuella kribbensis]